MASLFDFPSQNGDLYGGGAVDSLPRGSGEPQNSNQSAWETGSLGGSSLFATPQQLNNLGAGVPPNNSFPVGRPSLPPPPTTTPSLPNRTGSPGSSNVWGNQNPFMTNVSSTSMDGSVTPFASPGNPNVNYITEDAARQIAGRYGGNVVSSGNVMGGSVSAPMYGIDFGTGDPMSAGQIAFWEQRGDTPEQIRSRLFQSPAWWSQGPGSPGYVDPNVVRNNDVNWNFSQPVATNLPNGSVNRNFATNSATQEDYWKNAIDRAGSLDNLANGRSVSLGQPPRVTTNNSGNNGYVPRSATPQGNNLDINSLMQLFALVLGMNQRQPQRPSGNNLLRSFYYPRSEPGY